MSGEELTEQETALYDRQIRVWGVDAQRRLTKAHILVRGMKGTVAEFCKNVVLAGVGSLTLVDDRQVNEEALAANFMKLFEDNVYSSKTVAEVYCASLKEFNPMVRVSVEKVDVSSFGGDFLNQFDVVVVSCCSLSTKKLINEKCRTLSKYVAFYIVDCRGLCGEILVDLQNFKYGKKKLEETIDCELQYSSFEPKRTETPPDPTMEAVSASEEEITDQKRLQGKFKNLEQDWDSFKRSNPRNLRICLNNPESIVRSLQYESSSPESTSSPEPEPDSSSDNKCMSGGATTTWHVRTNELAVDEILRERRAAIENGDLEGRSLLEAFEAAIDCNGWSTLKKVDYDHIEKENENENENDQSSRVCCCDCDYCKCSSLTCDNIEGNEAANEDEEEEDMIRIGDESAGSCNKRFKSWLAACLILLLLAIIVFISGDDYGDDMVILVPT